MLTVLVSALQLVAFCMPPAGDLAYNPGTCPDWELNQRPFGSQARTQSTESHQPGLTFCIFNNNNSIGCKKKIVKMSYNF